MHLHRALQLLDEVLHSVPLDQVRGARARQSHISVFHILMTFFTSFMNLSKDILSEFIRRGEETAGLAEWGIREDEWRMEDDRAVSTRRTLVIN